MNSSIVIAAVVCFLLGCGLLVTGVYWLAGTGWALVWAAFMFLIVGVLALVGAYRNGVAYGTRTDE